MSEFGQLVIVLAGCISTTIGVCVYLLKAQQTERREQEARADKRIDSLVDMLQGQIREGTEVQRDLTSAIHELSGGVRSLGERVERIESKVSASTK